MSKHPKKNTPTGQALETLILETTSTFFLLRAAGKQIGAVTHGDGGYWGLLRSLQTEGPQTVPQLARSRPVSRQHIQKLANEMMAEGVIEAIENPLHKRSKQLRLTPKGVAVYQEISAKISQQAEQVAQDMEIADIETAIAVLQQVKQKLKQILQP